MKISSLADLRIMATQAEQMRDAVAEVFGAAQSAEARLALPPAPAPLTLKSVAQWVDAAKVVLRQPKVAAGKRHLQSRGIDPTPIPATVLEQTEELAKVLSSLDGVPTELADKAKAEMAAALTKGITDALAIAAAIDKLKLLVKPLDKYRSSDPAIVTGALAQIRAGATDVEGVVSSVVRLVSLKAELRRFGIHADLDSKSLADSITIFDCLRGGLSQCSQTAVTEALGEEERPDVQGKAVAEAQQTADAFLAGVESEKERRQGDVAKLVAKLEKLGAGSPKMADTLGALRSQQSELEDRLKQRQRALTRTLGKGAIDFLNSLADQKIPEQLTDSDVGRLLRKALECGYSLTLEPPHEDQ